MARNFTAEKLVDEIVAVCGKGFSAANEAELAARFPVPNSELSDRLVEILFPGNAPQP